MPSPPSPWRSGAWRLPCDGFAISAPPTTTRISSSTAATAQATSAAVRHGRIKRSSCWKETSTAETFARGRPRSFSAGTIVPRPNGEKRAQGLGCSDRQVAATPSASDVSGRNPIAAAAQLAVEDAPRRARRRAQAHGPAPRPSRRPRGRRRTARAPTSAMPVPMLSTPPASLVEGQRSSPAPRHPRRRSRGSGSRRRRSGIHLARAAARGRSPPRRPHRADPGRARRRCRIEAPRAACRSSRANAPR